MLAISRLETHMLRSYRPTPSSPSTSPPRHPATSLPLHRRAFSRSLARAQGNTATGPTSWRGPFRGGTKHYTVLTEVARTGVPPSSRRPTQWAAPSTPACGAQSVTSSRPRPEQSTPSAGLTCNDFDITSTPTSTPFTLLASTTTAAYRATP